MSGLFGKARSFAASGIRLLYRPRDQFERFQDSVLASTWKSHDSILDWAIARSESENGEPLAPANNLLAARGWSLKCECEARFRNSHARLGQGLRILIHVPDFAVSPGGYSLFSNMISALSFIGIPAAALKWNDSTSAALSSFQPTCLMTSDHESYLGRIDWNAVRSWKEKSGILVGLTASLQEYGNSPLDSRLSWAKKNAVDFYFSFRSPEYLHMRSEYAPFFKEGYPVFSIEFGANPALYYPVEQAFTDLDYIFLASSNPDKQGRYFQFLPPIVKKYHGFIDGPGWKRISRHAPAKAHKYLYARARVGINLHIPDSLDWANELNERTYILAACGIPQLVDSAKLLPSRFSSGSLFVASSPKEYLDTFVAILRDPEGAQATAARALEEVFAHHTTYHRVDRFVTELSYIFREPLICT